MSKFAPDSDLGSTNNAIKVCEEERNVSLALFNIQLIVSPLTVYWKCTSQMRTGNGTDKFILTTRFKSGESPRHGRKSPGPAFLGRNTNKYRSHIKNFRWVAPVESFEWHSSGEREWARRPLNQSPGILCVALVIIFFFFFFLPSVTARTGDGSNGSSGVVPKLKWEDHKSDKWTSVLVRICVISYSWLICFFQQTRFTLCCIFGIH